MRLGPWKLVGLVLFVACVHEVVFPDIAHAPGDSPVRAEPLVRPTDGVPASDPSLDALPGPARR